MTEQNSKGVWLNSKEAMKRLKISACELMHRRERGLLNLKNSVALIFIILNK